VLWPNFRCALLLWCTGPHIAIGSHVKVIKAWGFRPSTIAFDWIKQSPMMSASGMLTQSIILGDLHAGE
jgi:hypothetical protein